MSKFDRSAVVDLKPISYLFGVYNWAISILAEILNSGLSYLITSVMTRFLFTWLTFLFSVTINTSVHRLLHIYFQYNFIICWWRFLFNFRLWFLFHFRLRFHFWCHIFLNWHCQSLYQRAAMCSYLFGYSENKGHNTKCKNTILMLLKRYHKWITFS